jgi:hypothetical protein
LAEKVDGHDHFGAFGHSCFELVGVYVESARLNVNKNGPCSKAYYRPGSGKKAERGGNDLVPRTDPTGHEGKQDGVRAGCATDRFYALTVLGQFLLERSNFRAKYKLLVLQYSCYGFIDFTTNLSMLST